MDFVSQLEMHVRAHGWSHFGFSDLERPLSMDIYRAWIAEGLHGSMHYLADHADIKENPRQLSPRARAAIVIAQPYQPHPYGSNPVSGLRTALYAQGEDYHLHFRDALQKLASDLKANFPEEEFLCFTDSAPILERDLAYRAGLGWVGKNTCLIDPQRGSLFFIGQIFTSLKLNRGLPVKDFCGTCDRCIRACPTQAIEEPRKLNANKCIAYWTIEATQDAPESLKKHFGNWFFGCDICQTVCPWNEKAHGKDLLRSLTENQNRPSIEDLRWILKSSNKVLTKSLLKSPLLRARPRGLKRSALRLIGTYQLFELRREVEAYKDDPYLSEIACWALSQLP